MSTAALGVVRLSSSTSHCTDSRRDSRGYRPHGEFERGQEPANYRALKTESVFGLKLLSPPGAALILEPNVEETKGCGVWDSLCSLLTSATLHCLMCTSTA
uniref:Uncharacterized protein n=1 Tax=Knipowitschia caucasica TaxID=637954 RepID=A0AAV2KK28_KNICA